MQILLNAKTWKITLGHQDEGLEWLNSVEHLLECYGDSRTEAYSGIEIHDY